MAMVQKLGRFTVRQLMPDFYRCDYCGYTYADSTSPTYKNALKNGEYVNDFSKSEEDYHRLFHLDLMKSKYKYGKENVLSFSELNSYIKHLFKDLESLKKYSFNQNEIVAKWRNAFNALFDEFKTLDFSNYSWDKLSKTEQEFMVDFQELERLFTFEVTDNVFEGLKNKFVKLCNSLYYIYIFDTSKKFENSKLRNAGLVSYEVDKDFKDFETNRRNVDGILKDLVRFEFSRSLRMYDYTYKVYPSFKDYYVLLWNTPRFINIVSEYLTESQLAYYVKKNLGNRKLAATNLNEAPFYFGRVFEKEVPKGCSFKDLSVLDKLDKIETNDDELWDESTYIDTYKLEDYKSDINAWIEREKENNKLPKIKCVGN